MPEVVLTGLAEELEKREAEAASVVDAAALALVVPDTDHSGEAEGLDTAEAEAALEVEAEAESAPEVDAAALTLAVPEAVPPSGEAEELEK